MNKKVDLKLGVIFSIESETGVQMNQTEEGVFEIFASDTASMNEAKEAIDKLLEASKEPQLDFGAIYRSAFMFKLY